MAEGKDHRQQNKRIPPIGFGIGRAATVPGIDCRCRGQGSSRTIRGSHKVVGVVPVTRNCRVLENSCNGLGSLQDSARLVGRCVLCTCLGEEPITTPIEFYFDFVSPFGFFAATQIDDLAAKHGRSVAWKPFNLRTVAMTVGFDRPMIAYPIKGSYFAHDIPRMARLFGIDPWNVADIQAVKPAVGARAFYWVADQDEAKAKQLALWLYRKIYSEGVPMSDPAAIAAYVGEMGLDSEALAAALAGDELRTRYKEVTQAAMDKGVFGSPFFIVDGEPFFGSDRLWMIDKWLADGGW